MLTAPYTAPKKRNTNKNTRKIENKNKQHYYIRGNKKESERNKQGKKTKVLIACKKNENTVKEKSMRNQTQKHK